MERTRTMRYPCALSLFHVVCLVAFSIAAAPAVAQTITVNGSSSALEINRGVTIAVAAGGGSAARDWVGLYTAGAAHSSYLEWWYLNGTQSAPASPIGSYTRQVPMNRVPGGYELRYFANDSYSVLAQSGVVTVKAPQLTVNGVAAPGTVSSAPAASIQVDVASGQGSATDWVGIFRPGASASGFLDWSYLNGTQTVPQTGLHSASFTMTLPNVRGPYELRLYYNSADLKATSPAIIAEARTRAAGGDAHTLVVRPDGSVWAAGLNGAGQLGDDTTTDRLTAIQVPGLSNVVSVAAGVAHSMALTATGSVYVWGANDRGQVGDGTNDQSLSPTLLSLTNVVAIAAGDHHSIALTSAGSMFTWGLNGSGELGNGSTTNSNVPIQVATGVVAIGAGDHFTLFVKSDGTVWGTGKNEDGTLGDGSYTNRTSPVQMSGVSSAVAVAGGRRHSVVLRQPDLGLLLSRPKTGIRSNT